uniref:3-oxoacyl-[acyl-carrier-protein] synthase-3 n=1 Tax=Candidatus Kentrum sp. SD TaxID=2126332 RepID=A0A450Z6B9_9GAMM|nr:MAG: 3-oxoacyl-[acyl-carrier-protein] synthase-3 [Candidatus Kentron sp. SD]VFK49336.1 MAG: 3-oxoacyl-[acyl-carrier-protein] synthase-3 [Candidatus Kentron sp. SD]
MKYSCILGSGHYLPSRVVSNFDIMKMMETSNEFIVKRTGVHYRRYAESDMSASALAVPACEAAVKDAGLCMEDIDFLIMNTITPDHADPGCAFFLQDKLGLPGIGALDIRQQCAGLIYGLSIADHFVRAGTYHHVLVACSEVLSKRVDGSPDGKNLAILLGDGAGAVVVGAANSEKEKILSTTLHADGSGAKILYTAAPGSALGRAEHITKGDIDTGRVHFRMNGKAMFENGVARISEAIFESLETNGITLNDIDAIIPHQPNLRMLEAVMQRTGIPQSKTFINVHEYGNIASASLPIALDQARGKGVITNGSIVLLVAFGSGFVWGSALLQM